MIALQKQWKMIFISSKKLYYCSKKNVNKGSFILRQKQVVYNCHQNLTLHNLEK